MKIKIGEKVYLQKYDVARILQNTPAFPGNLVNEIFDDDSSGVFYIMHPKEGLEFSCVFEDPTNVEWLMSEDWIIDHDEYAKMSVATLKSLYRHLEKTSRAKVNNFNLQPREYRELHYDEINLELYKEAHKLKSLRILINELTGIMPLNLPDEDLDEPSHKEPASNIVPFRLPNSKNQIASSDPKDIPKSEETLDASEETSGCAQDPFFSLLLRLYRRILSAL